MAVVPEWRWCGGHCANNQCKFIVRTKAVVASTHWEIPRLYHAGYTDILQQRKQVSKWKNQFHLDGCNFFTFIAIEIVGVQSVKKIGSVGFKTKRHKHVNTHM